MLDYRAALVSLGVTGTQWLSGSFLENVELIRGRPPGDVDVVTIFNRPPSLAAFADWRNFLAGPDGYLFKPRAAKAVFKCDLYNIDLNDQPEDVVNQARFWFGLFSHQKLTYLWKGMVAVDLDLQHDPLARSIIQARIASNLP